MQKYLLILFFLKISLYKSQDIFDGEEIPSNGTEIPLPDLVKNSQSEMENLYIEKCICKKVLGECNSNCCCDTDCTEIQKKIWADGSKCIDQDSALSSNEKQCIDDNLFSWGYKNENKFETRISSDDRKERCVKTKGTSAANKIDKINTIESELGGKLDNFITNKLDEIGEELKKNSINQNYQLMDLLSLNYDSQMSFQFIKASHPSEDFLKDKNAFVMYQPDLNGYCYLGKPVIPFNKIEPKSCIMDGEKLKKMFWYLDELEIADTPIPVSYYALNESKLDISRQNLPSYHPLEFEFHVYVDSYNEICSNARVLVMDGGIDNEENYDVKFSLEFNSLIDNEGNTFTCRELESKKDAIFYDPIYSGNPGYEYEYPLRVQKGDEDKLIFMRSGAFINKLESYSELPNNYFKTLKFGVDFQIDINLNGKKPKEVVKDILKDIKYIGQNGVFTNEEDGIDIQAELENLEDKQGIKKIVMYVFYESQGKDFDSRNIITDIKFSAKTQEGGGDSKLFTFAVEYVLLNRNMFEKSEYPKFLPPLPLDLSKILNTDELD